jgi:hypothetical protein
MLIRVNVSQKGTVRLAELRLSACATCRGRRRSLLALDEIAFAQRY